jgi:nucleoside-diphosphate-sugar epimerase
VLTSSFAAVGYSPKPVRDYTEEDWTDPDTLGLPPYPRSKAIAERAAWEYTEQHPGDTELVVLNPTFIIGPSLVTALRSSLVAIKAIAEGTLPALPRQRFGVADVRDVADAHVKAAAAPDAAGKRYLLLADGPTITWLGLAEVIRDHLGAAGANVALQEAPGEEPSPLTIHNDRAKQELGWQPRPAHTTITDTVDSLRQLGLLEAQ